MLKTGHHGLVDTLAAFFNGILHDDMEAPETWRKTKLKVIFKKGDPELPDNYRPISIIPVLAKLYSTILYGRMRDVMDSRLADEQFGFRKGRGCSDAIHIVFAGRDRKVGGVGGATLDCNPRRREGFRSSASLQLV